MDLLFSSPFRKYLALKFCTLIAIKFGSTLMHTPIELFFLNAMDLH